MILGAVLHNAVKLLQQINLPELHGNQPHAESNIISTGDSDMRQLVDKR